MATYKVFLHRLIEQAAIEEIEARTVNEAMAKAQRLIDDGLVQWFETNVVHDERIARVLNGRGREMYP